MKNEWNNLSFCKDIKRSSKIMGITAALLCTPVFPTIAAETDYQESATVTITAEQIALTELLSQIEKQSEFLFFYVDQDVAGI